jgi:hypothetical protein
MVLIRHRLSDYLRWMKTGHPSLLFRATMIHDWMILTFPNKDTRDSRKTMFPKLHLLLKVTQVTLKLTSTVIGLLVTDFPGNPALQF